MKIALVNVQAPFVWGGAEYLAESLTERLRLHGHEVDLIRIPFQWNPPDRIIEHMLACRLLEVHAGEPDLVIALKFPAYLTPFSNKKLWLLHQFRQVYELWGGPYQGLPDGPEGERIRAMIIAADNRYLPQATQIFTNSKIVANRLWRFNGIRADEVLYPPLRRPELFHCGEARDYFFYPSRLNPIKRQALAIEAMRFVKSPFQLVVAGKSDNDSYQTELEKLVRHHGLEDKVRFLGWITEEEKARWMSTALAALYLPYDEDSYGYVTLEAFHSSRAVLTLNDSGGTNELVEHEHNGLILEPSAEALAEGMERCWADRTRLREMGQEAYATLTRRRIDWNYIVERLVA